ERYTGAVPFSVRAVAAVILLLSLCRSATFWAISSPFTLCQGPLPMRSFASTVLVDRYARQVLPPAPTACARDWQCASAPAKPPKSPPLPGFVLVTKKLMFAAGDCANTTPMPTANTPSPPRIVVRFIGFPPCNEKPSQIEPSGASNPGQFTAWRGREIALHGDSMETPWRARPPGAGVAR